MTKKKLVCITMEQEVDEDPRLKVGDQVLVSLDNHAYDGVVSRVNHIRESVWAIQSRVVASIEFAYIR